MVRMNRLGGRAPSRALRSLTGLMAGGTFGMALGAGLAMAGVPLAASWAPPPPATKTKAKPAAAPAPKQPPADTAHHFSGVIGVAIDSIHGGPLRAATVTIVGTKGSGVTDSLGQFRIDSGVPAG